MKNTSRLLQKWNSLHNQFLLVIALVLIFPLLLSSYWIDKPLETVIETKIGNSAQEALNQANGNLELFFQDVLKAAVDLSLNPGITAMLKQPEATTYYDKLRITDSVLDKLHTPFFTETYVTLLDRHGSWMSTKYVGPDLYETYLKSDWYRQTLQEPYGIKWLVNDRDHYLYYDKSRLLTLVKTVTDANRNIGTLLLSVKDSDLQKMLAKLEGEVVLLDQTGRIISSSVPPGMEEISLRPESLQTIQTSSKGQLIMEIGDKKWIAGYATVGLTGWKLVQYIPHETVFSEIYELRRTNRLTVAGIGLVFMLLAVTVTHRVTRPLKLLNKKMSEIEKNDFNSSLHEAGPAEISTLIATYNGMSAQIRDLLRRLKEEYRKKEEMRFRALQAQINPHFILNTLNNIKWMAYIREDREVGEMLSSLGSMMEASIGRGETLIPLKEELDYIGHYVTLMKLRFSEKLTLHVDVPPDCGDQEMIKLLLQPLVENSIRHGIELLDRPGVIAIGAEVRRERGLMILTVADNGCGISGLKLEALRKELAVPDGSSPGVGLRNVQERIRLHYGGGYGLEVDSEAGAGTTVTLKFPLRQTGERRDGT
ncbi:sensor histidine kinase [Paenibacillus sp. 1P03SA]|uniref:sensor histidine kinase n=1 Tax=Paenibacillus sp. 1P03SA TaxID=3132294 RepID=UPI0039A1F7DA